MKVVTLSSLETAPEPQKGPAQPPIADLAGKHIDEDVWKEWRDDPHGRDIFSKEQRYRAWAKLEEEHMKNRGAPLPVNNEMLCMPPWGIHLMPGIMGKGKTLVATDDAVEWYRKGWTVMSTAGLLFGQRLRIIEAYSFPNHVPPGGLIFIDELHTFVDTGSSGSIRDRTFAQATTSLRKEQVTVLGASAAPHRVAWTYKLATSYIFLPDQAHMPPGKRKTPPFCNLRVSRLGPGPYHRGDPVVEQLRKMSGTRVDEVKLGIWYPDPTRIMESAKHMDSFESIRLGEAFDINSARMAEDRAEQAAEDPNAALNRRLHLYWSIISQHTDKENLDINFIRDQLNATGAKVTANEIRTDIQFFAGPDTANMRRIYIHPVVEAYRKAMSGE